MAPNVKRSWMVSVPLSTKKPFAGPEQVLDYVGRYTHRVAISNNRLLDIAEDKVTFRYKDYRQEAQQSYPVNLHPDRLRPLQMLIRDPASKQYT